MKNIDIVLQKVLGCTNEELIALEKTSCDLNAIIEWLFFRETAPTLDKILEEIFREGMTHLRMAICDILPNTTAKEDLKKLNPEMDLEWVREGSDVQLRFAQNKELYQKHLKAELQEISSYMGFHF